MPFNPDGSWTSPTGRKYPADTPQSAMDPADQQAFTAELRAGQTGGPGDLATKAIHWAEEAARKLGIIPNQIDANAPGSNLDTTQSDQDRQQQQDFIRTLQQQAATGDGAWQENFKHGIESANANAQALGQSSISSGGHGIEGDYGEARRNIGNAQGAVAQKAVGDEQVLREQAKQSAEDQLGEVYGGMGNADVQQAATQGSVRRGVRQTNNQLFNEGRKNLLATAGGLGAAFLSDGGRVPGKPKVFGDDSRNDTVPAMLTPEEIVLPLSVVKSPNAPEAAADFVRSLRGKSPQHFADGGSANGYHWTADDAGNGAPGSSEDVSYGTHAMPAGDFFSHLLSGPDKQAPTIDNGGRLDTSWADAAHDDMADFTKTLQGRAAGSGSVANIIAQKQNDERLAQAQTARAPQAAMLGTMADADVKGAAGAAENRIKETRRGGEMLGKNLQTQRALDLGSAEAQQEAGWSNTLTNSGLDLQGQQFARNLVSGVGQGASALFHSLGSSGDGGGSSNSFSGRGSPSDLSGGNGEDGFAGGGVIKPHEIDLSMFLDRQSNENQAALDDFSTSNDYASRGSASDLGVHDDSTLADDEDFKWRGGPVGLADGGAVKPLTDVMHSKKPVMTPDERESRWRAEMKEEGGGEPSAADVAKRRAKWNAETDAEASGKQVVYKAAPKKEESDSLFARALHSLASIHFAEGGQAPLASYDPNALPPRKDNGPVVYLSTEPTPGSIPVPTSGAGGASGSDSPQSGAGGGGTSRAEEPSFLTRLLSSKDDLALDAASRSPKVNATPAPVEMGGGTEGGPGGNETPPGTPSPPPVQKEAVKLPARAPPAKAPPAAPTLDGGFDKATRGVSMPYEQPEPPGPSDEQKAALAIGDAEAQGARAAAEAKQAELDVAKKAALDDRAVTAKARLRADESYSKWQRMQDEISRIDTTVDPGRYWASKSTGSKILGIIGLALGALGAGNDGVNKAAVMMGQAIDRDLEAQKAEHTIRLQKGRQQTEGLQSLYAMAHQAFGDEVTAMDAARAAAANVAKIQTEAQAAKINEPVAKQKAIMLAAQMGRVAEESDAKVRASNAEARLRDAQAGLDDRKGLGGTKLSPTEQGKVFEVKERAGNIRRNIARAKEIISKYGTAELVGPEEDELKRILLDTAQDAARMKDAGSTVRDAELKIQQAAIGLHGGEWITPTNSAALKMLDRFESSIDDREDEALKVRGLGGSSRRAAPQIESFSTGTD